MDAGEKLMGLKKAYADIILNTAKEAAARVMVSERKALRFEYELKNAKEEALQMLMRLKHMMDSKIREAEIASCTKQKKIEELEAQLQEAEDIVKDLREDLCSVQAELERFPPIKKVNFPEKVNGTSENNIAFPPSEVQLSLVPPFDTTNSKEDQRGNCEILCNSLFPLKKSYISNTDLPSIISRSKEIELYRNGFSQRIRACEQTLVDTKAIKPEPVAMEDQESEKLHNAPRLMEEKQVHVDQSIERLSPCRKNRILCPNQVKETDQEAHGSSLNFSSSVKRINDMFVESEKLRNAPCLMEEKQVHVDQSTERLSPCRKNGILCPNQVKETDQEAHGSSLTFSSSVKHINDIAVENFCDEITNTDTDSVRACDIISEELAPIRGENAEFSQDSKTMFDLPLVNSESKSNEVPIRSTNDRVIKYTFQRKRKRGTLSTDGNASNEKGNNLKRKEEDQNGHLESEKTNSVQELTREKIRVEPVANQLILFS